MALQTTLSPPDAENSRASAPGRSFWKFWFPLFLVCILFGFWARRLRDDLRAYTILTHFVSPQASGPLLRFLSNPVTVEDVTMSTANGVVRGKLYRPVGISHPQGMVVVHGIHHLGMDEPRLVSFARGTAEAGLAVFTPEISALADYHVDPASVATICDAPGWLQHRMGGGPVIVTTLSFSGGLALLAARNPDCESHIGALVLFGSYDDLARVSRFLVTGHVQYPDGTVKALPAHAYGPQVFVYANLADFFSHDDIPAAHEALRYWVWEEPQIARPCLEKLSPAERSTMEDLFADRIETLRAKMLEIIRLREPELVSLSPHAQIGGLQVPVFILHGSADNVLAA